MMNVLAVDPAMKNIGIAWFKDDKLYDADCLKPSKLFNDIEHEQVISLARRLYDYIIGTKANIIIAEVTHGYIKSMKAAKSIYKAESLVQTVAGIYGARYIPVNIHEAKEALTGKKRATKHDMMDAVRKLYPDYPFPKQKGRMEHIADAIGVYEAYKRLKPYKEATGEW